jgi:shikimate dehydrogenase
LTNQISGHTRLAAVIGSPVRHSLSPAIHNAAFQARGLDWRFLAFEVLAGNAAEALVGMRALGIGGLAVTTPHKRDVALAVDDVDVAAAALESVNTVVLREDGTTFGTSTDGAGFVDSVHASGVNLKGARIVVLGAGAAARSIVDALGRSQVSDIAIVNRTVSSSVSAAGLSEVARVGSIGDIADADVLVNGTSIGMATDQVPLDVGLLRPDLVVAEIVYHPIETALLRAARKVGAVTIDGLGMLVYQAVLQQQLWTGISPDPGVMRTAAESELTRRVS